MNRTRATRLLLLVLLALTTLSVEGCKCDGGNAQNGQGPIEVGSILSLSGTLANYGELEKRGLDLAVEHINQDGGINGRELKVIYEDSALDPKKAISAYHKLSSVDSVPMIVGCVGSSVCLALAPQATRDEVVLMSAGATSPKLSGASPFFFRVAPSDTLGAAKLVDWAVEAGAERVAIVYIENDYGAGQKEVAIRRLGEHDIQPAVVESVVPETSDLRPQVERVRQAKPDTVFLLTHSPEAAFFLKQADEVGFTFQAYGGDALSDPSIVKIAGGAAEHVRFLMPAKGSGAEYDRFTKAYRNKYDAEPDAVALKGYSLMLIAADALRSAEYNGAALREYLASHEFESPMGNVKFDENGDLAEVAFDRLHYHNGTAVPFIKTVSPE